MSFKLFFIPRTELKVLVHPFIPTSHSKYLLSGQGQAKFPSDPAEIYHSPDTLKVQKEVINSESLELFVLSREMSSDREAFTGEGRTIPHGSRRHVGPTKSLCFYLLTY